MLSRKSKPATPGKRMAARKRPRDFADYGTAFGLDMSLSNDPLQTTRPASAAPSSEVLKAERSVTDKAIVPAR